MYILQLSDFWLSIGETLQELWKQIGDWNWDNILQYFQNISLSGVALFILGIVVKVGIPMLKNSGKKTLQKLAELYEKIISLEQKNQTIGAILKEWIVLQSEVNKVSKTLTDTQKKAFTDLAEAMRMVDSEEVQAAADKIDEIVEDNEINAQEMQELIESTEIGQVVMGTNVNDILPKEE